MLPPREPAREKLATNVEYDGGRERSSLPPVALEEAGVGGIAIGDVDVAGADAGCVGISDFSKRFISL